MTIYCDTSVMVSAFAAERDSVAVEAWLSRQTDSIAISSWVIAEFSGALAMKRRMHVVDDAVWTLVMQRWRRFCADSAVVQPVDTSHFVRAGAMMDRGDLKLRSGDALHLAIALDRGWLLATLDHDLAEAARTMGVPIDPVLA